MTSTISLNNRCGALFTDGFRITSCNDPANLGLTGYYATADKKISSAIKASQQVLLEKDYNFVESIGSQFLEIGQLLASVRTIRGGTIPGRKKILVNPT
jgi:hypothetical protein